MDVVVEFGDYPGCAIVPAEYQGALGPRSTGHGFSDGPFAYLRGRSIRECYRAVVFGDEDDLVFRCYFGVRIGVQQDPAIFFVQPDHRARLVSGEGLAKGHARETWFAGEVDLIPTEVEQVRVDEGES